MGLSEDFLIRVVMDELIEDEEKLKKKLFPHKGK
jgi:hypothetical protein